MKKKKDQLDINSLESYIRDRAKRYAIPDRELNVDIHQDVTGQKNIARVHFRTPDRVEKYQAEIAFNINKNNKQQIDIINRQIDDILNQLEEEWLTNGGNVIFYNDHGFFYTYVSETNKACLEVQCTACNYVERVDKSTDILDEYRDVFLMKLLPKAHGRCDCPAGKYGHIQRPRLHGL